MKWIRKKPAAYFASLYQFFEFFVFCCFLLHFACRKVIRFSSSSFLLQILGNCMLLFIQCTKKQVCKASVQIVSVLRQQYVTYFYSLLIIGISMTKADATHPNTKSTSKDLGIYRQRQRIRADS